MIFKYGKANQEKIKVAWDELTNWKKIQEMYEAGLFERNTV